MSAAVGSVQRKVAIVTGASQGTGAGLITAYRRHGFAVVACSRSLTESRDSDVLAFAGDHADPGTARRIVDAAVAHFGRVDTLIHDAGVFMPKPFTMHSPQDYVLTTGDKVSGFFHLTQRVITQLLHQGDGGHVVTLTPTRAKHAYVNIPSALADLQRRSDRRDDVAGKGVRAEWNPGKRGVARRRRHPHTPRRLSRRPRCSAPPGAIHGDRRGREAVLYLEAASLVTGEILHLDGGHLAGR